MPILPEHSNTFNRLQNRIFPFQLTAAGLADRAYYEMVLDAIQELCIALGIFPCMLDAAIFSSADK